MAQPVQSTSVHDAFKPYENKAIIGSVVAAVGTLINPIAGAAIAVYHVTDIGANLVADHFKVDETNPIARVARAAVIGLVSVAAAFATICALKGAIVILTSAVIAVGIFSVCFSILSTFYLNEPSRSVAST